MFAKNLLGSIATMAWMSVSDCCSNGLPPGPNTTSAAVPAVLLLPALLLLLAGSSTKRRALSSLELLLEGAGNQMFRTDLAPKAVGSPGVTFQAKPPQPAEHQETHTHIPDTPFVNIRLAATSAAFCLCLHCDCQQGPCTKAVCSNEVCMLQRLPPNHNTQNTFFAIRHSASTLAVGSGMHTHLSLHLRRCRSGGTARLTPVRPRQ